LGISDKGQLLASYEGLLLLGVGWFGLVGQSVG